MGDAPSSLVVVIPARNEERRLNACLLALRTATQRFRLLDDAVPVRVILVLDRRTDHTAVVAARWPSVEVVMTEHGRVGAARAAGVRHAMTTAGAPAACGSPTPTPIPRCRPIGCQPNSDAPFAAPILCWEWCTRIRPTCRHICSSPGSTSTTSSTVTATSTGRTWACAPTCTSRPVVSPTSPSTKTSCSPTESAGWVVVSTNASPVLTSARLSGRTPGGMAAYLRDLGAEPAQPNWTVRPSPGMALG